jgi:hypothetical protein
MEKFCFETLEATSLLPSDIESINQETDVRHSCHTVKTRDVITLDKNYSKLMLVMPSSDERTR